MILIISLKPEIEIVWENLNTGLNTRSRIDLSSLFCSSKYWHKICLLQDVVSSGNSASAEHFVDLLLPVLLDHLQMPEQIVDELLVKKKCERMVKAINVLTDILFYVPIVC